VSSSSSPQRVSIFPRFLYIYFFFVHKTNPKKHYPPPQKEMGKRGKCITGYRVIIIHTDTHLLNYSFFFSSFFFFFLKDFYFRAFISFWLVIFCFLSSLYSRQKDLIAIFCKFQFLLENYYVFLGWKVKDPVKFFFYKKGHRNFGNFRLASPPLAFIEEWGRKVRRKI
jgi:hypothetical protein